MQKMPKPIIPNDYLKPKQGCGGAGLVCGWCG
ncbi:MAG TPA: Cys-rich RiPP peptide [Pseudothermotoga sp.]|nr:Cys-rich RiPP peptide [Thermotoga profunda]HOJ88627.1 Cys-rich RiPP peptide [Pseudothermotoga sp.]HOK84491.1 Cys-rich RiPP peptide [Pseudothermotoga sp.]HPP71148.1 Cys-rich RiPP peptide [Pseudothermotoga sp.]